LKHYEPESKSTKHRSFLIDTNKFKPYVFNRNTERDNYVLHLGKTANILKSSFKNVHIAINVKHACLVLAYFYPEFKICELIRLNS
jgi:hypothetical protein